MKNIEISSSHFSSVVSTEPPAVAPPKDEDVDLFNAALRGETTAPSYADTAQAGPQKEVLPQNQEDQIFQAAAQGAENLAKVVQQLVSENPSLAEAIAAYASKLDPTSAATFAEVAIKANPQAAAQIAVSVAEVGIKANPQAAAQIAASVTEVAIKANPQAAAQIAASIAEVAIKANPQAVAQIAASVTEVAIKANPQAAAQIASSVAEVAIKANPQAAAQIAASVAEAAIKANPQAAAQVAGSVFSAVVNAIPNIPLPNTLDIAARIAKVAVRANPGAAPDIAAEMMKTALSFPPGYAPAAAEELQSVINEVAPKFAAVVGAVLQNIQTNTLPNGGSNTPATPIQVAAAPVAGVISGTVSMATGGTTPSAGGNPAQSQNTPSMPDQAAQSGFIAPQATAASVGGSNTVPQASPKVIVNLLQLIASTVSNMKIDETQTTIVLQKTAELPGEVTIEVRMSKGALEVAFKTSDPTSIATLENNILALQTQLQKSIAISAQVFLVGQSPEDKSSDFDDSKSEIGTDSKTGQSNEGNGKDKVQKKSQNGGAQQ